MKDNLKAWLQRTGLNELQAKTYLAALSTGSGEAREIADKAEVSRTGVYEYLEQLTKLGFLQEVRDGKRKKFVALHPKELAKRQQSIALQLKDLLPDFLALYARDAKAPFIQQFEGAHAARELFEDILTSGIQDYCYISAPKETYSAVDKVFMKEWITRRVKKGIQARALRVPTPDAPRDTVYTSEDEYLRQIRYLPSYIDLKATIYVYGNNVAVLSARDEQRAYIIYSPDFAFTMRSLFELLWGIGTRTT